MTERHAFLKPFAHSASNHCFGCGPDNTSGLHLEFQVASDGSVVSMTAVSGAFDGHPGYLHGGIIATLLDEAMSKAVRAKGRPSVTRKLEVEYLRPVPSGAPLRIEGHVVRDERHKHFAEASILNGEGRVLAQGKGLFIEIASNTKGAGGPLAAPAHDA